MKAYDDGALQVIVEAPRSSLLKLDFDPKLGLFTISRELPLGVAYRSTGASFPAPRARTAIRSMRWCCNIQSSYPGVVLRFGTLGMVEVGERDRVTRATRIVSKRRTAT